MMTDMTTTQILAGLIGLYFVSAGIGLLIERPGMQAMFDELKASAMLGYMGGILAFAIGGTIVAIHNDWSSLLAGFVSLIGWISLLEGALLLAFRRRFLALFDGWMLSASFVAGMGGVTILVGALLWFAVLAG